MNVFRNKIDEQSVSGETVWLSVQTNSHAHRSLQINLLLIQWDKRVNLLIQRNDPNLT